MTQIDLERSESETKEYVGQFNKLNQRDKTGFFTQSQPNCLVKYNGTFTNDNFHGDGIYTQIKHGNNFIFEGTLYANTFEGYAKVIYGNCVYYEGLYKNNKRFGPGVVYHTNNSQDVGFWNGTDLMRLAVEVNPEKIPNLARTPEGKLEILKHRRLISLMPETPNKSQNQFVRNQKSYFFNRSHYDKRFNFNSNIDRQIKLRTSSESAITNLKNMIFNTKGIENCTPKEICLLQQKFQILSSLLDEGEAIPVKNPDTIEITDILAWNNEEYLVDCLLHAFKHRNREYTVQNSTSKIRQNKRHLFNSPGTYETACKLFLETSSDGNDLDLVKLHQQFQINPDLTDSKGNSGIFYAAASDKLYNIKRLVNIGADLNIVNDENLTALNLCFLRYIALRRNIKDWENAFLIKNDTQNEIFTQDWKIQSLEDLLTHTLITHVASIVDNPDLKENKNLIRQYLHDIVIEQKSLDWFFAKMGIDFRLKNEQSFETTYYSAEDPNQKLLFDWSLVPPSIPQAKSKTAKKPSVNVLYLADDIGARFETDKKLNVISNTIEVLLRLGASLNCCDVPLPTIILALYCDNHILLDMLIEKGAIVTNVYTSDELNLLHILCSLPPTQNLYRMAGVLLKAKVNPMQRCSIQHWSEEIENIKGDIDEIENEDVVELGKTPLHILAARVDFDIDPEKNLNSLAKTIAANNPKTLKKLYLGHSPLSLAVLRGNINLVQTLLEAKSNPNQKLGNKLGNALTIYCLKRYSKPKMIPPVNDCNQIIDMLVMYGADPLMDIDGVNAIEFIGQDNESKPKTSTINTSKKVNVDQKQKMLKTPDNPKKLETPKGSKLLKDKEKHPQQKEIFNHLLNLTKEVILTNYQEVLGIFLFKKLMEGSIQNFKHLFQFLTHEDGIKIISMSQFANILDLTVYTHYFLAYLFLECINLYGIKDKEAKIDKENANKQTKGNQKSKSNKTKMSKQAKSIESKENDEKIPVLKNQDILDAIMTHQLFLGKFIHNQYDPVPKKYKVCFNCCLHTDKELIACPVCGIVYFCSQKCNEANIKSNSRHPCKVLFYDEELKKKADPNATSVNNMEVTIQKLSLNLPKNLYQKSTRKFMELVDAIKDSAHDETKIRNLMDSLGLQIDLKEFISEKLMKKPKRLELLPSVNELIRKSLSAIPFLSVCTSFLTIPKASLIGNIINISSSENFVPIESKATVNLESVSRAELNDALSNLSDYKYIRLMSSMKPGSNMSLPALPEIPSHTSLVLSRKMPGHELPPDILSHINVPRVQLTYSRPADISNKIKINKTKQKRESKENPVNKKKSNVHVGRSKMYKKNLAAVKPNYTFIKTLATLFPEFDFTSAMTPFVCYSDSQFYYRFSDSKPEFFSTHM